MILRHARAILILAALPLGLAGLPVGLAGQELTLAPHTARNLGLAGTPALIGLSATYWTGPVGARVGAGMDVASSPLAPLFRHPRSDAVAAWHGDLDLVLNLGRAGLAIGAVEPVLLTGFGAHGRRLEDGSTATIPVWSYGGGTAIRLGHWVSLDFEARYRMPHESDPRALPTGVGAGWEARAGLAVHLGRARTPAGTGGARTPRVAGEPSRASAPPGRAAPGPGPSDAPPPNVGSGHGPRAAAVARSALATAHDLVGVRYVWGGNTPAQGFDCSGFVRHVFARHGISLPRVSRDQARAGVAVRPRLENLLPGDLMFYAGSDGVVNHVAIYAGDNRIIHSSASGRGVRYDDLGSRRGRYYATRIYAVRRVIGAGAMFTGGS